MTKDIKKTEDTKAYKVLIEPRVTEAATLLTEKNKYIFKVDPKSGKAEIKKAIEDVYGTKVSSVNTISIHRKKRIRGRTVGWKPAFKKAIVTLKEGEKIDIFEGK